MLRHDTMEPELYAQSRANKTGKAYFVTIEGHAWLDCRDNRALARKLCGRPGYESGIAGVFKPIGAWSSAVMSAGPL